MEVGDIADQLKEKCFVQLLDNSLEQLSSAILIKKAKEIYYPFGELLTKRVCRERQQVSGIEQKVAQSELCVFTEKFFYNSIQALINGRKPKRISKTLYRDESGNFRTLNQKEVDEAYYFNEEFLKDVKSAIKLMNLANSCGLGANLSCLLQDPDIRCDLYSSLWIEIVGYYAHTTHENIVWLTQRREDDIRELKSCS